MKNSYSVIQNAISYLVCLEHEHLTITKADKGNTLIIIDINHYNQKIDNFIANSKYTKLNKDHTKQQKTMNNHKRMQDHNKTNR
jgi:hypothetical protein